MAIHTAHQDVSRHQRRFLQTRYPVSPYRFVSRLDPDQDSLMREKSLKPFRGDLSHVTTLATKLRELNVKVADIQREQRYMREVEATFRDASELTNTRAVWWSLGQIAVLIAAAIWQMRYLKVGYQENGRFPGFRC